MKFLVLLRKSRDKKQCHNNVHKNGGYIHSQTALEFELILDAVARKDRFQEEISVT